MISILTRAIPLLIAIAVTAVVWLTSGGTAAFIAYWLFGLGFMAYSNARTEEDRARTMAGMREDPTITIPVFLVLGLVWPFPLLKAALARAAVTPPEPVSLAPPPTPAELASTPSVVVAAPVASARPEPAPTTLLASVVTGGSRNGYLARMASDLSNAAISDWRDRVRAANAAFQMPLPDAEVNQIIAEAERTLELRRGVA